MKRIKFLLVVVVFLCSCQNQDDGLDVLNSVSFPEGDISVDNSLAQRLLAANTDNGSTQGSQSQSLEKLISQAASLQKTPSDTAWKSLLASWDDFRTKLWKNEGLKTDTASGLNLISGKWAGLSIRLLKLSGDARFGDEMEDLLYRAPTPVLTEQQLKSVIFTHIDDRIFINVLASSGVVHHHTTGGNIKLVQQAKFPENDEMTLKCETGDVRFVSVFIRIPNRAINPTVTHGNVKYVARRGQYCEISRKWKAGDEINVRLKN